MTRRWISLVPSPIVPSLLSRGALDRVVLEVAVAAVDLHGVVGDSTAASLAKSLAMEDSSLVRPAASRSDAACQASRRAALDLRRHVRDLELDGLEVGDGWPNWRAPGRTSSRPPARPGRCRWRRRRCRCVRDRGSSECPRSPLPSCRAGSRRARGSPRRQLGRVGRRARPSLSSFLPERKPFIPRSRMKAEMPLLPSARSVTAIDHARIGDPSVGDERLGAVEHPMAAVAHRRRLRPARVRARAVLGQTPAADLLAARERGRYFFFCSSLPARKMWPEREAVVGGHGQGHAGVDARELLHHDRVVQGGHPGAAVFRGPDHAHEAELAELREDLARELLLLVPFARVRTDLRLRELPDGLLEELLLLGKAEVQSEAS